MGEPSPGVPPLRAAPAARSLCDTITPVVNERRAGMEPRPYEWIGGTWWGRRWMKARVVGDADPYGSLRAGPCAAGFSGCGSQRGKW